MGIPWEVPEGFYLQTYAAVEKSVESQVPAIFMYRMRNIFPSLVPVSSLCQRQLAYIVYESWLLGISAYIYNPQTSVIGSLQHICPLPLARGICAANFSDLDSRVVYQYQYQYQH